jgi:hypothetical protein
MKALIKYHASAYVTSAKFVMPLLVYFLFLVGFYGNSPKMVVTSFALSAAVLYIIMVWAGFVFSDSEEAIAEQILILKAKKISTYYISKIVFLFVFSCFMSFIGVIAPVLFNIVFNISGKTLFYKTQDGKLEGLTAASILIGFLIHILAGFLGGTVGFAFHPRIFRNRKVTVIVAMLVGFMGFVKGALMVDFKMAKFFVWIFPPMYDLVKSVDNTEVTNVFPIGDMILPLVAVVVYSVVLSALCVFAVQKKGF